MEDLQQATEKICELYGSVLALQKLTGALLQVMPREMLRQLAIQFDAGIESQTAALLGARISEHVIGAFEHETQEVSKMIQSRMQD